MVLEALQYDGGSFKVLDQLQLPYLVNYDEIRTCKDGFDAIKQMRVRGAPLIAMVAALSLAVELEGIKTAKEDKRKAAQSNHNVYGFASVHQAQSYITEKLDYLLTSRPTAVNLQDCAQKLKNKLQAAALEPDINPDRLVELYKTTAGQFLEADLDDNQKIGEFGAQWIIDKSPLNEPLNVLTHCNTGSLATSGYGTALGVIRSLHSKGRIGKVYCTETRPYNQGSRLTAFELVHDQIDACLITDSMAAALMKQRKISAVVVGADRVVSNGDTANKIGTYSLAISAHHHKVPFLVAAPQTTIDTATKSGTDIKIEERAAYEMTSVSGPLYERGAVKSDAPHVRVSVAAEGIEVWNPAFDVTPANLINGIVTEVGVIEPDQAGDYDMTSVQSESTTNDIYT